MFKTRHNATDVARVCNALSSEARVAILRNVAERSLCVGAIARSLRISQPAVSQHLRVLKEAGLVHAERMGCFIHYGAKREALEETARLLQKLAERTKTRVTGGKSCARKASAKSRKS